MTKENPYEPVPDSDNVASEPAGKQSAEPVSSGRAAYNIVSDTVVGLNTRTADNRLQAKCILIAVPACAIIAMVLAALIPAWDLPWYAAAMIGGVAGLILGTFGSGIFLMVYRGVRHLKGEHD